MHARYTWVAAHEKRTKGSLEELEERVIMARQSTVQVRPPVLPQFFRSSSRGVRSGCLMKSLVLYRGVITNPAGAYVWVALFRNTIWEHHGNHVITMGWT